MERFVKVANKSNLQKGQILEVEVGGDYIVLAWVDNEIFAVGEACGHVGGPLADGYLDGEEIECPWHGSRFCLKNGEVRVGPATEPIPSYAIRIEGDDILLGPANTP